MTLDIIIDQVNNFAICQFGGKLLKCQAESNNQNENQLIRLSEHKKGKIKINNLNSNYFIPLRIILEFISSYYIQYNSHFNFFIQCINDSLIPTGSILSLDLDIQESFQSEIAFCEVFSINNSLITLSCSPYNNMYKNYIIRFSNIKSYYSSISWKNEIDEKYLELPIKTKIYILNATNRHFDQTNNIWSFTINLKDFEKKDYFHNSKIVTNLLYNGEIETASCRYNFNSAYQIILKVLKIKI